MAAAAAVAKSKCRQVVCSSIGAHPTFEFLVSQCGFSAEQASAIHRKEPKLWKIQSTQGASNVVDLLRHYRFSDSHIRALVWRTPAVLQRSAAESLRPKLEELVTVLGINEQEQEKTLALGHIVSSAHRILSTKNISSNVMYLQQVFGGSNNFSRALKRYPLVVACNRHSVDKRLEFLRQLGFGDDDVFTLIFWRPQVLHRSEQALRLKVEFLKRIGVPPSSKAFVRALSQTIGYCEEKLQESAEDLASIGLTEHEVKEVVTKLPSVLAVSLHKRKKIMEYLVKNAGLQPNVLVKYPKIICLSFEKNILPRHLLFAFMQEHKLFERAPCLPNFLNMSWNVVLRKYLKDKPELLEFYRCILEECGQASRR